MPNEDKSPPITGPSGLPIAPRGEQVPDVGRGSLIVSAALIGAGVLVEPELLGGALLGAGVVYGLPIVGRILRPIVRTAVRLGYSATASVGGIVAEASQQVRGIVADARAELQRSESSSL